MLNAEAIVSAYLREEAAVKALQTKVQGQTPEDKYLAKPWIRVTLLDPQNVTGTREVEWLMAYYLQLDCYAGETGGQAEAFKLAQAVRNALVALPSVELEGAVATDVEFLSMPRIPDTDFSPARERYIADVVVYMHPKP